MEKSCGFFSLAISLLRGTVGGERIKDVDAGWTSPQLCAIMANELGKRGLENVISLFSDN